MEFLQFHRGLTEESRTCRLFATNHRALIPQPTVGTILCRALSFLSLPMTLNRLHSLLSRRLTCTAFPRRATVLPFIGMLSCLVCDE